MKWIETDLGIERVPIHIRFDVRPVAQTWQQLHRRGRQPMVQTSSPPLEYVYTCHRTFLVYNEKHEKYIRQMIFLIVFTVIH